MKRGAEYTIYLAAQFGDAESVRAALERDRSQANHADTRWWRPITAAARRRDFEMLKLLLEHGADPNLPEDGAPIGQALWTAVYLDEPDMVKLLLEHGANPNTSPASSGSAVGHARRNPEVLALLLRYGAKEESRPFAEIDQVIEERRFEELETLLRQTGLMSRQGEASWGEGILGGPANKGDLELIEVLIRCSARVPDVTKWGRYYYFKHADVARYLLEHGMNANHQSWQEVTLLHDMAHEGSVEKARLLLDHGAEMNAIDGEYRSTPLGFAARWNRRKVALLLIEHGRMRIGRTRIGPGRSRRREGRGMRRWLSCCGRMGRLDRWRQEVVLAPLNRVTRVSLGTFAPRPLLVGNEEGACVLHHCMRPMDSTESLGEQRSLMGGNLRRSRIMSVY
jgi:ankyrin repeat protein